MEKFKILDEYEKSTGLSPFSEAGVIDHAVVVWMAKTFEKVLAYDKDIINKAEVKWELDKEPNAHVAEPFRDIINSAINATRQTFEVR